MEKLPKILRNYPGNKNFQGMAEKIINQIPPHDIYIEHFAGSATIGRIKKPAPVSNTFYDKDRDVVEALQKLGYDAHTADFASNLYNFFSNRNRTKNVFMFLDPPYPIEYRLSKDVIYKYELSLSGHKRLLRMILRCQFNVMICTNPNPLYESMLAHWRKIEVPINYQGKPAIEVIYMNYPEPTELHEYTYLGNDCWERQKISRKIKRHVSRLNKMPVLERNAIVEQIKNNF